MKIVAFGILFLITAFLTIMFIGMAVQALREKNVKRFFSFPFNAGLCGLCSLSFLAPSGNFIAEKIGKQVKTSKMQKECDKENNAIACYILCEEKNEDYCSINLFFDAKNAYDNGDYKQAQRYFDFNCTRKSAHEKSCFYLAKMYEDNKVVRSEFDKNTASNLYAKACSLKFAPACNNLGVKYQYGENGVRIDKSYATELYEQACNLGDKEYGCTNAGIMYKYGDGVFRDKTKAFELLKKGCIAGSEKACREKDDLLN